MVCAELRAILPYQICTVLQFLCRFVNFAHQGQFCAKFCMHRIAEFSQTLSSYSDRTFAATGPRLLNSPLHNPNITYRLFRRQLKGQLFWDV